MDKNRKALIRDRFDRLAGNRAVSVLGRLLACRILVVLEKAV